MNIRTMHIGIELGLQELNSNLWNTLQHEEKDYYINRIIENFVRAVALKEDNDIKSIISYADIQKYYETINPFIRDIITGFINYESEGYIECIIPRDNAIGEVDNITGMLYDGVTYRVQTPGITDLSGYGYFNEGNQVVDDEFVCNIIEITSLASYQIWKGEIYRIINNPENIDCTVWGAISNEPGSQFTVNMDATIESNQVITLKPIAKKPNWDGLDGSEIPDPNPGPGDDPGLPISPTELIAIDNLGKFEFISSESFTPCGLFLNSGVLEKDQYYGVLITGTTDLSSYGAYITSMNDINLVFKSILTGTPTWSGGTRLIKLNKVPNRLIKYQDKGTFLNHAYGTLQTSPVSTMIDNKLRIYHDRKFTIFGVYIQYVKTPNVVDYVNEIDCNLPSSIHGKIVDWTVMKIAGVTNNPAYNTQKDFEVTDKSIPK